MHGMSSCFEIRRNPRRARSRTCSPRRAADDYIDDEPDIDGAGESSSEDDTVPEAEQDDKGEGDEEEEDGDDGDDDAIATSSSEDDDEGDGGGKDGGKDGGEQQPKGFLQGGKVDSFSRAFNRLVDNVDGLSKAPILAGSKSVHRRKEEEKLELEASKAAKKLREEMKKRGHYLPTKKGLDPQRDILEKRLQKTATKGVVQLFNAINTAQKRIRSEDTLGKKAKAAKLGKAGFLAGIRQVRERQAQEEKNLAIDGPSADVGGASGKWDVLKGGFVGVNEASVRMRDWDAKEGNVSDGGSDGGGRGGGPSDSDDDGF